MTGMKQVSDDDPLMVAWKAYQKTDDYANTLNWYGKKEQEPGGTLWAAFMAGFTAAVQAQKRKDAAIARDMTKCVKGEDDWILIQVEVSGIAIAEAIERTE